MSPKPSSIIFGIILVQCLVAESKQPFMNCEIPAARKAGALLCWMVQISVVVSRSLKGQTFFCPACLMQPVSLKHSSAFGFIHLTVVDPSPLVAKFAVLVMSVSTTSKALVCAPAFKESTHQCSSHLLRFSVPFVAAVFAGG